MKSPTVVIAAAFLSLAALAFAPAHASSVHHAKATYAVPKKVTNVQVDDEVGKVVIMPGAHHTVTAIKQWNNKQPTVKVTTHNGILTVKATCPSSGPINGVQVGDDGCSVDLTIVVPATSSVRASTDVGDVITHAMASAEVLTSSAGDVAALRATGSRITTQTDEGDITVTVPEGAYNVTTHTDQGHVSSRGITKSSGSKHSIRATTSEGDIHLSGY